MRYLALLLLLVGCSEVVASPKFSIGDCVDSNVYDGYEFIKPEPHIRKILKVGKENYLYLYGSLQFESTIYLIDKFSEKVDCPTE